MSQCRTRLSPTLIAADIAHPLLFLLRVEEYSSLLPLKWNFSSANDDDEKKMKQVVWKKTSTMNIFHHFHPFKKIYNLCFAELNKFFSKISIVFAVFEQFSKIISSWMVALEV